MGWFDAAATYSSGKTPKYKVGDKVYKRIHLVQILILWLFYACSI